jgi:hypothetical protein
LNLDLDVRLKGNGLTIPLAKIGVAGGRDLGHSAVSVTARQSS